MGVLQLLYGLCVSVSGTRKFLYDFNSCDQLFDNIKMVHALT